jgi:hypothetical protein
MQQLGAEKRNLAVTIGFIACFGAGVYLIITGLPFTVWDLLARALVLFVGGYISARATSPRVYKRQIVAGAVGIGMSLALLVWADHG